MEILTYIMYTALALFVAYLWLSYLRLVDVFQLETWRRLGTTFFIGCFSVLPVLALHEILPHFMDRPQSTAGWLSFYVFKVGLVEEISKLIFAIIALKFFIKGKEPVDYVVHGAAAALGFATVENVLYLNQYGVDVIRGRASFSALIHMCCTAVPMYFYARNTFLGNKNDIPFYNMVGGLAIATILHGLYDFSLEMSGPAIILMLIVYLVSLELWLTCINNMLNISPHFKKNITPNTAGIQKLLMIGFISLSFIELIYSLALHNWDFAYVRGFIYIPIGAVFLVMLVTTKLSKIRLIPNKQFPLLYQLSYAFNPKTFTPNAKQGKFSSASYDLRVDSINEMEISAQMYRKVRLVSRDGSLPEAVGVIVDKIWAYEDETYFKFEPLYPVEFRDFRSDHWLLKAQTIGNTFYRDVFSELCVLLMPLGSEIHTSSKVKEFPTYGRFYLVPLAEEDEETK